MPCYSYSKIITPIASNIRRYPPSPDRSLTAVTAADRLLVEWGRQQHDGGQLTTDVYHDRFGAIGLSLSTKPTFVLTYHSQGAAIQLNAKGSAYPSTTVVEPPAAPAELALLRVPKSLQLFELYLSRIATAAAPTTRVAAGFMTRHFTPRLLEIAARYAGRITQSRARQKARLLLLEDFHPGAEFLLPRQHVEFLGRTYLQYPGVFSAGHIDYATQFLLGEWQDNDTLRFSDPAVLLDVACGNGIIGGELLHHYPAARLLATDDSVLASESARLNLPADRAQVYWQHTLAPVADASVDLAVINPPFHFGHEQDRSVSLGLFRQIHRTLRPGGSLVVVANLHLNYATHLRQMYRVAVAAQNDKFVIYRCDRD